MKRRSTEHIRLNKTVIRTIRWTSFMIAAIQLVFLITSSLSNTQVISVRPIKYLSVDITHVVISVLLTLNLLAFAIPPRSTRWIKGMFVIFYGSLALFSLWITQIDTVEIIATSWLILLAATGIVLGRKWLLIGDIIALSCTVIGWLTSPHVPAGRFMTILTGMLAACFVAYFIYALRESGAIQLRDYNRLKLREHLQTKRLRAVVNNMKDLVISADNNNLIQLYNSAALDLLDTNRNLSGLSINNVFHLVNEDGQPVKLSDLATSDKVVERNDLLLQYSDNQRINLHLSLLPIHEDYDSSHGRKSIDGYIVIARDITKQKSLDDERDEFISVVSHELRTPVAIAEGALSNLQFLLQKKADPAVFGKTLDAAHNQILYLGQIVNDLSTLSRAQRGVYMDNEDINIENFMNSLISKYQGEADKRGLYLKHNINTKGTVSVPSMAIEEIMQNILTNALKYTKTGGVTIGVEPGSDSKHVKFYVKDTGIGISKSDMPHVFQRFWRSEDYRTRETSGTGLGLHVVDQLAHKIGTQIRIESELNQGSCFSFELPRAK